PCRTFQHAHNVVAVDGEIDVLDPAGYGALTIGKAISIQGHGFAGIGVTSGATGITINAGPSDVINLNGLLIDGTGVGNVGIVFNVGRSLTVESCVIRRFVNDGIDFGPNASSGRLAVSSTQIANNGGAGIAVIPGAGGGAQAVFNHVEAVNNGADGI